MTDYVADPEPVPNGPAPTQPAHDGAGPADAPDEHQRGAGGRAAAPRVAGGWPASVSAPVGPQPAAGVVGPAPAMGRPAAATPPGPAPPGPAPGPAATSSPAHGPSPAAPPGRAEAVAPEVRGQIHIADEVVEKVAGLAATEVVGVADLGGDIARALESVRERIGVGHKRGDQGVKAEVKGQDVAITVTITVEFGHVVLDVARRVQVNVARQTERMLGLNVVEVNVTVDDVHTPAGDGHDHHPAEVG